MTINELLASDEFTTVLETLEQHMPVYSDPLFSHILGAVTCLNGLKNAIPATVVEPEAIIEPEPEGAGDE